MNLVTIEAKRELRFSVADTFAFNKLQRHDASAYHLKLKKGSAEIFGVNIKINEPYSLLPGNYSVFSWYGCSIEINSALVSRLYEESDSDLDMIVSIHGNLEILRAKKTHKSKGGPRICVVGPEGVGKSTISRTLASYCARCEESLLRSNSEESKNFGSDFYGPVFVDLDPRDNSLSLPGCISAEPDFKTIQFSVSDGLLTNGALTYFTGYYSPSDQPELFQEAVNQLARMVDAKISPGLNKSRANLNRSSGVIIDTFPVAVAGVTAEIDYKLLLHVLKCFRVDIILVLGFDRLASDLKVDLDAITSGTSDPAGIHVLKLPQSGAAVKKDETSLRRAQSQSIKRYFEGFASLPLAPTRRTFKLKKGDTSESSPNSPEIFLIRVHDKFIASEAILPVGEEPTIKPSNGTIIDTVTIDLVGKICAISYAKSANEVIYQKQCKNIAGFCFIETINADSNSVSLLMPSSADLPSNILVIGNIFWREL